ncbi:hypothetical protein PC9H_010251 [Pleurotus ostreatus]|uniref:Carbamoyl-phosphate synthetase large subunit oligomerisation domain-containing protein n=1 Tax=Pleurotus ostreatus TaxID=5322 RepID=A0A8H6ZV98_PLEOS|nr:uncharacterized protein PC9H_010251 [Pleurotus ostreatus]KAF7424940.1 hypothetical protein PC9H_010251 [Pleurotus ostreatus]
MQVQTPMSPQIHEQPPSVLGKRITPELADEFSSNLTAKTLEKAGQSNRASLGRTIPWLEVRCGHASAKTELSMDAGGYITAMAGVHMAGGLDGKMEHTVSSLPGCHTHCRLTLQNAFVENVNEELCSPSNKRIGAISTAFHCGYSMDKILEMTNIDRHFLGKPDPLFMMEQTSLLCNPAVQASLLGKAARLLG